MIMKFYSGGYFLVRAAELGRRHLPFKTYSVSNCICDIYPDIWGLSWTTAIKEKQRAKEDLKLDDQQFRELEQWLDCLFEDKKFGWLNVFLDIDTAREFYQRYLKPVNINDVKLLGIGLAETYLAQFLEEERPPEGIGTPGIYQNLSFHTEIDPSGTKLGFEVLGYDHCGIDSMYCNYLDEAYRDKLGIIFNEYGLINTFEKAITANDYTCDDSTGAEPVNWLPWLICEYEINR